MTDDALERLKRRLEWEERQPARPKPKAPGRLNRRKTHNHRRVT
jgi:hypothetical protein